MLPSWVQFPSTRRWSWWLNTTPKLVLVGSLLGWLYRAIISVTNDQSSENINVRSTWEPHFWLTYANWTWNNGCWWRQSVQIIYAYNPNLHLARVVHLKVSVIFIKRKRTSIGKKSNIFLILCSLFDLSCLLLKNISEII
jgi:hypothetical protein